MSSSSSFNSFQLMTNFVSSPSPASPLLNYFEAMQDIISLNLQIINVSVFISKR